MSAELVSSSPDTDHIVYFLSDSIPPLQKKQVTDRLFLLGLPTIEEEQKLNLKWDSEKGDEENYLNMELVQVKIFFRDPKYL